MNCPFDIATIFGCRPMGTREIVTELERLGFAEMDACEILWRSLGSGQIEFNKDRKVYYRRKT